MSSLLWRPRSSVEVGQALATSNCLHVVVAVLADLAEGLDADGQFALGGHGGSVL